MKPNLSPIHSDTISMNQTYIRAITQPNATEQDQQIALHNYLTDPRRTTKVECYCTACKGDVRKRVRDAFNHT